MTFDMHVKTYGLSVNDFIRKALEEDIGDGDHTSLSTIPADSVSKAVVKAKENGVVAGLVVADQVLNQVDAKIKVKVLVQEGGIVKPGDELIHIEGNTQSLLKAERVLLNCLQRMSGIATKTCALADMIKGTSAKLLDTRKTTPNFRIFEKWAVQIGGGMNHRFGLYDMILIKDNHVDACGGIEKAIESANEYLKRTKRDLKIEIETRSLAEVQKVLNTGNVHRIMLDNFPIQDLKAAVKIISGKYETEASGGITEDNIREIAMTGVNFISVGALTHSFNSLDISMKIVS